MILLVNLDLDILKSGILGVDLLIKVRNLAVISELSVNDVNVLDSQLELTKQLFLFDDAR